MVDRSFEDRKIAEKLAKVAGLRGYASLTADAKQALVDVLRKYAASVEHCESIVDQWVENHTEVPTPFELREMAAQVMAPQAAAIAKAASMSRCGCCQGTGFDSYDSLVYSIQVPNFRKPLRRELRLAALARWQLDSLGREALASASIPDELLHPSAIAERDRVAREISQAPQNLQGYDIVAYSNTCTCRRLAS